MTYEEALSYIHSICWKGSKLGLDRTRELLGKLDDPQKELKFIHIAGTNGKGSTAAMLSSILEEAGYRVGLYTSPFINRFNERMQVNHQPIPDEELAALTEYVRPHADAMADSPTEFELITALAMVWFARQKCDIVVLEVGMGGELDSTNIIDVPEAAVIAAMGLDHVKEAGPHHGGHRQGQGRHHQGGGPGGQLRRQPGGRRGHRGGLPGQKRLPLPAGFLRHRPRGLQPGGPDLLLQGLARPPHPPGGGLPDEQRRRGAGDRGGPPAAGVERLRRGGAAGPRGHPLARPVRGAAAGPGVHRGRGPQPPRHPGHGGEPAPLFPDTRSRVVTGVMADKDVEHILGLIVPLAEQFFTVRPDNPRAMDAGELARRIEAMGAKATACASVRDGVDRAIQAEGPHGVACALGSLYMSGEVRSCFGKN